MTSPHESLPALAGLLRPFPVETFLREHWERAPLHIARGADVRPLLTLSELDAIITTGAHRHPNLSLVDAAAPVDVSEYASETGSIDTPRAIKRFGSGASIVLNHLDDWSPRVRDLCVRLGAELGLLVQANLYLTPGGAQGFPIHYDSHDVVIVQCEGRKNWRLYDSPLGLPMAGERFDRELTRPGPLSLSIETAPGDALYIPRGMMHEALAVNGETSLHVTVGLHAVRWSEVLLEALADVALGDSGLREGLPLGALAQGADDEALDAAFRAHLTRVMASVKWSSVRQRLVSRFVDDHKESLVGMLHGVASPPEASSVFETRAGLVSSMVEDGDALVLTLNGRATRWPGHAAETLRIALSLPRFTLDDLGDALDLRGRLTLARRLVTEGAVRVAQSSNGL